MKFEPRQPKAVEITVDNLKGIIRDVVNENNDTSNDGARSTAVQNALFEVLTERGTSGRVVSPASRAKARLAVLIAASQEFSERVA